jgi:hypothetical protein
MSVTSTLSRRDLVGVRLLLSRIIAENCIFTLIASVIPLVK